MSNSVVYGVSMVAMDETTHHVVNRVWSARTMTAAMKLIINLTLDMVNEKTPDLLGSPPPPPPSHVQIKDKTNTACNNISMAYAKQLYQTLHPNYVIIWTIEKTLVVEESMLSTSTNE